MKAIYGGRDCLSHWIQDVGLKGFKIFMKFSMKPFHKISSRGGKYRKNSRSDIIRRVNSCILVLSTFLAQIKWNSTEDPRELALGSCEFRKNWSGEIHTLLKRVKKRFFRFFHIFSQICMKFGKEVAMKFYCAFVCFTKIHAEKDTLHSQCTCFATPTSRLYYSICVKFWLKDDT